jgi:hypothetical protein
MKAAEKIPLIEHCATELAKLGDEADIDFVLRIVGIPVMSWNYEDNPFTYARRCISDSTVSDAQLRELAEYLDRAVIVDDTGLWLPDTVRVFLSHLALEREFVSTVAEALAIHGLNGFVAHQAIEVNKKWATEIQRALRSTQVLVGLVHQGFSNSYWVNQEIGWALGRDIPIFMVRLGEDPAGFLSDTQWPSMVGSSPKEVANAIAAWTNTLPDFADTIGGRLIKAFADVKSFFESRDAAAAIAALGSLTDEQWSRLEQVYWSNDQIYRSVLADRVLRPFYEKHRREYPPPDPRPT